MRKIISLDKPELCCPDILTASEILIRTGVLDKPKRGGKRDGAGRKHKYGEETQRLSIPISLIPHIMAMLETHKKD